VSRPGLWAAGTDLLSRRGALLVTAAAVALGATLFFSVFGAGEGPARSAGADSFSRSALGYHALAAFLEQAGATVVATRYRPLDSVGPQAGLMLLEPPTDPDLAEQVRQLVEGALDRGAPVLVVLPERSWQVDAWEPSRVARVDPLTVGRLAGLVAAVTGVAGEGAVDGEDASDAHTTPRRSVRGLARQHWEGPLAEGARVELVESQTLPLEEIGMEPELFGDLGGVVLRDPERRLTLVTDPDLLNNHGIGRGDNALVARRLFLDPTAGGPAPAVWVIDETLHGFERAPSVARELLAFPLSLFSLQVALLAIVAVWSAVRRFGSPVPLPPRIPGGTATLVENTARLLDMGGHHAVTLHGYLEAVVDRAGEALGVRVGEGRRDRITRLSAAARQRGVGEDLEDIARRVAGLGRRLGDGATAERERGDAFILARRLHRWCEEVLDGAR